MTYRSSTIAIATRSFAFAALTICAACAGRPAPPPAVASNVLIVTIDTLRADRVGVYGATTVGTPNIDRLAREGAWAPQADVHAPLTRPSHVSLFTGLYPAEHGIRDNVSPPLGDGVPLLASLFERQGFATAAFIASSVLDRQSGLARGFGVYSDRFDAGADQRTGDVVAAEAIAWLKELAASKQFFAWVHLYDPHAPYNPPEPYAGRYAARPYDGEVAWCDELVGRLVAALRETGMLESTLMIVTSDHGEALGDHGEDVHGYFVYEATLRVPLVVRGPGIKPGGRLGSLVRTVDLFPTILDMTGLGAATQPSSGRSLAPALRGGSVNDEPSFAESLVPLLLTAGATCAPRAMAAGSTSSRRGRSFTIWTRIPVSGAISSTRNRPGRAPCAQGSKIGCGRKGAQLARNPVSLAFHRICSSGWGRSAM